MCTILMYLEIIRKTVSRALVLYVSKLFVHYTMPSTKVCDDHRHAMQNNYDK